MSTRQFSFRLVSTGFFLGLLLILSACEVITPELKISMATQEKTLLVNTETPTLAATPYPPPDMAKQGLKITSMPYPPPTVEMPSDLNPTEPPTDTPVPVPTAVPTPLVTSIPVAQPPFLPELAGKESRPFWLIYWEDNEIRRIDNQGKDDEFLVDVYKESGQWLSEIPDFCKNNSRCWIGSRVSVSPDGSKLALVLLDKIHAGWGEFTFSISLFDIQTRTLTYLDKGQQPTWSYDSSHLAYLKDNNLWAIDLATNQSHELAPYNPDLGLSIPEFTWPPDDKHIAYLYTEGPQRIPTIWVVDANKEIPQPQALVSLDPSLDIYGIMWSYDNQSVYYLSSDGTKDFNHALAENLWSVDVSTGERTQLTSDIDISGYLVSRDNRWFFITGHLLYGQTEGQESYNLWLFGAKGQGIWRLIGDKGNFYPEFVCPDDTCLYNWNPNDLNLFYLNTGKCISLDFKPGWGYLLGGVK